jgi:hypothetical protein
MLKTIFTVYVGGGVVYEGTSRGQANHVYELWLDKGYDDVVLEVHSEEV